MTGVQTCALPISNTDGECAHWFEAAILREGAENVAAIIAEPVKGAGGVWTPADGYFQRVREICDRYDVLFIADEVITGFGRTGKWFALEHWGVQPADCTTEKSVVTHKASGRKLSYAELAAKAATMTAPDPKTVPLKARKDWKLIGTRQTGVDNIKVVTGQPLFGIDTVVPNMLYATYTKCPAQGGTVKSANLDHIKTLPGVKDAFVVQGDGDPESVMPGVAIVAISTFAAMQARKQLQVTWDESKAAKESSAATEASALMTARQQSVGKDAITTNGDANAAFASAAKTIEAIYSVPFLKIGRAHV